MRRRDKCRRVEAKGRVKGVVAGVVRVLDHSQWHPSRKTVRHKTYYLLGPQREIIGLRGMSLVRSR